MKQLAWLFAFGGLVPAFGADAPAPSLQTLSLDAAVRLSVSRNPDVLRAKTTITSQQGAYRQTRGQFDPIFDLNPTLKRQEGTLTSATTNHEFQRRLQLQDSSIAFAEVRDEYAQAIAQQVLGIPVCPGGFTTIQVNQTVNGSTSSSTPGLGQVLCVPIVTDTTQPTSLNDLTTLVNTVSLPQGGGASRSTNFITQLAPILGLNVAQLSQDLEQRGLEVLQQGYKIAIEGSEVAALDFARLGGIPNLETVKTATFETDVMKTFRFGLTAELQATLQGVEDGYSGKVLDPVFGGREVNNVFTSNISLILTQPLGQGRGTESTGAAERAAKANLEAATQEYQHQMSVSALQTVNAYLNVAAAQDNIALIELSIAANRKTLDAMQGLFKAGEKSRIEVDRVAARLADVEGGADDARLSLLQARGSLATVAGLKPEEVEVGPFASQKLASTPIDVDYARLARDAKSQRRDLRASEAQRDSAEILEKAASANLRHVFNLSVTGGLSNAYYSPFFRVLKSEFANDPTEPTDAPIDYFDPKGISRAWKQRWEPQLAIKLTFAVPFKNRTSEGKLVQAQATYHRAEIQTGTLSRLISENVTSQSLGLQRARAELERATESVKQHEATWDATQQLLKAGDISVIDAIVTEQDLTSSRLNLVQAQLTYAQTLAQLRFESGALVKFGKEGPEGMSLDGLVEDRPAR